MKKASERNWKEQERMRKFIIPYQWEKKFQHSVAKNNKIYRVQLPKIAPHVFHRTYCTNTEKLQISVETLKYPMDHTDISVTSNVYTYLKLEDVQKEMEKLKKVEAERKIPDAVPKRGDQYKENKYTIKNSDEYE